MDATPGPAIAALAAAIAELHQLKRNPSAREVAKQVGHKRVSHSTANTVLRGRAHLVTWKRLAFIITALGGDPAQIEPLWLAARQELLRPTDTQPPAETPTTGATAQPAPPPEPKVPPPTDPPDLAGVSPINISREAFHEMLTNYTPDRAEDIRRVRYVIERIAPADGALLLARIPARLAGHALAVAGDRYARRIADELQEDEFAEMTAQADGEPDGIRDRLQALWAQRSPTGTETPPALSATRPESLMSMPPLDALDKIIHTEPALADRWGISWDPRP